MTQGPVAFGVQQRIEIGTIRRQQLFSLESVKAQQPVRLVEAMLPQQRHLGCREGAAADLH